MYNPQEVNEIRAKAALELLRHKALIEIAEGGPCYLNQDDINEVFIVAGLPVIVPGEVDKKELEVM